MTELPPSVERWRAAGRFVPVFGRRVFVVERGEGDGVPLAILHGYPGSALDFEAALPSLSASRRVVVHDQLGFGLSEKPADYSYSFVDQADFAVGLWQALGLRAVHLVAHDYGTSVATELICRHTRGQLPVELRSVTLCNGSVHIELAELLLVQRLMKHPSVGPLLARLSSFGYFRRNILNTLANPVPDATIEAMWALLIHDGGRERLPLISRYVDERYRLWHRWIGSLPALDRPTLILWGRLDPIARPSIAETLAGEIVGARLRWLDDIAHWPMLEAPARWAGEITGFLREIEAHSP